MKDKKGKAKEVVSKIKSIASKTRLQVNQVDETLRNLQHSSAKSGTGLSGTERRPVPVAVAPAKPDSAVVKDADMTNLADMLQTKS